jgi:hypothetical protein
MIPMDYESWSHSSQLRKNVEKVSKERKSRTKFAD